MFKHKIYRVFCLFLLLTGCWSGQYITEYSCYGHNQYNVLQEALTKTNLIYPFYNLQPKDYKFAALLLDFPFKPMHFKIDSIVSLQNADPNLLNPFYFNFENRTNFRYWFYKSLNGNYIYSVGISGDENSQQFFEHWLVLDCWSYSANKRYNLLDLTHQKEAAKMFDVEIKPKIDSLVKQINHRLKHH